MRRSKWAADKVKAKIIKLKLEQPWLPSRYIGHEVGVDHTYVLKVLKAAQVSTRLAPRPRKQRKKKIHFKVCRYCKSHLNHNVPRFRFCDDKCRDLSLFDFIECFLCKSILKIRKVDVARKIRRGYLHFFCNRKCFETARKSGIIRKRFKSKSVADKLTTMGFTKSEDDDIIQ